MDPHAFLTRVFGDAVSEKRQLVVFAKPQVRWCASLSSAAKEIESKQGDADVYFGVALQDKKAALARAFELAKQRTPDPKKAQPGRVRGFAQTAQAIGGLWLDVDYQAAGHKKVGYPPTRDAALSLIADMPAQPTIIVETGGGFHPWWLFDEPYELVDDETRKHAAWLSKGWQSIARLLAATKDWKIDSTFDLARVLRVPGTTNHKYGFECRIESDDGPTWTTDAFETWIPDGIHVDLANVGYDAEVGTLTLDPNADPPGAKLAMLLNQHADFADAWHRRKSYESQSEADLALATFAIRSGWGTTDVVKLLIAHRREGGHPVKLRQDYYNATLKRAGAGAEDHAAHERIMDRITVGVPTGGDAKVERGSILHDVSVRLGMEIEIVRVVRMLADPPTFRVELTQGVSVTIGPVSNIMAPDRFQNLVAGATRCVIPTFKRANWRPIAAMLLRASVDEDIGPDSSVAGVVGDWLQNYLATQPVAEIPEDGVRARCPFQYEGAVHIRANDLRAWLNTEHERVSRSKLAWMLRTAGAVAVKVHYIRRDANTRTSTSAWKLPGESASQANVADPSAYVAYDEPAPVHENPVPPSSNYRDRGGEGSG